MLEQFPQPSEVIISLPAQFQISMPILDSELRRQLANRIRYYNELGIYDFYRREGSAAEPLVAEAELAVAVESTVADFGAAVRSAGSPQEEMTAKRTPK